MEDGSIDNIGTDYRKWEDASKTWGASNHSRAIYTADLIPDNSSVLDVGAASKVLKQFLKPNCIYTPSDIIDRGDGCIVADLNEYEFPSGTYDVIVMIGVLEYVNDVRWAITRAGVCCPLLIFTYNVLESQPDLIERRRSGWHSHLSLSQIADMISQSGCTSFARDDAGFYKLMFR